MIHSATLFVSVVCPTNVLRPTKSLTLPMGGGCFDLILRSSMLERERLWRYWDGSIANMNSFMRGLGISETRHSRTKRANATHSLRISHSTAKDLQAIQNERRRSSNYGRFHQVSLHWYGRFETIRFQPVIWTANVRNLCAASVNRIEWFACTNRPTSISMLVFFVAQGVRKYIYITRTEWRFGWYQQ